jgi:chromosome partition protein MukE
MSRYQNIADVVMHPLFAGVDMSLRKGRHIAKDEFEAYEFLMDANHLLEPFYAKYSCQLVYQNDGYFYLLPSGDQLGNRHLSAGEMLIGQALTLLYFDPNSLSRGGIVTKEQVITRLVAIVGTEALVKIFHPRKKKINEKVMGDLIRSKLSDSLRRLAAIGFIESLEEERYKLKSSLMRFAEPVRTAGDQQVALESLISKGEVKRIADDLQGDIQGEEEALNEEDEGEDEGEDESKKDKQIPLNEEIIDGQNQPTKNKKTKKSQKTEGEI